MIDSAARGSVIQWVTVLNMGTKPCSLVGSASVEQSKEARKDAIITSSVKAADLF